MQHGPLIPKMLMQLLLHAHVLAEEALKCHQGPQPACGGQQEAANILKHCHRDMIADGRIATIPTTGLGQGQGRAWS